MVGVGCSDWRLPASFTPWIPRQVLGLRVTRRLVEGQVAEKEAVDDLFQEGSSWSGSRNYTQNGPNGGFQDWKLVILTRDGDKFTGEIHFTSNDNKAQALAVKGIAPPKDKGKVVFKTEQLGVFQQSFKGVLAGGQISLTFSGTGVEGTRVTGTGTLTQ